jgi:hypothetical protein
MLPSHLLFCPSQSLPLQSTNSSGRCGFDDYPGPPHHDDDTGEGIRVVEGLADPRSITADVPEDLAGFFVQCDLCKVWQHGGCVGIPSEEESPEEYFCEECRKDLHRIFTDASNGYVIFSILLFAGIFLLFSSERGQPQRNNVAQIKSHKAVCFPHKIIDKRTLLFNNLRHYD